MQQLKDAHAMGKFLALRANVKVAGKKFAKGKHSSSICPATSDEDTTSFIALTALVSM